MPARPEPSRPRAKQIDVIGAFRAALAGRTPRLKPSLKLPPELTLRAGAAVDRALVVGIQVGTPANAALVTRAALDALEHEEHPLRLPLAARHHISVAELPRRFN